MKFFDCLRWPLTEVVGTMEMRAELILVVFGPLTGWRFLLSDAKAQFSDGRLERAATDVASALTGLAGWLSIKKHFSVIYFLRNTFKDNVVWFLCCWFPWTGQYNT